MAPKGPIAQNSQPMGFRVSKLTLEPGLAPIALATFSYLAPIAYIRPESTT
jgi:hypothetical protein